MKMYRTSKAVSVPIAPGAYVIDILAILFVATVVLAANRNAHSVSDMFYMIFPYAVTTFLLREWVASKLS